MATRWRNKLAAFAALVLLTVGVNGVAAGLADFGRYSGRSFLEASGIGGELGAFVQYLAFFELAPVTFEEAARQIRITRDDFFRYRNEHDEAQQWRDEEIRGRIAEEKKANLERHFESLDRMRTDYYRYRNRYAFYFTESGTGTVYTNLDAELEAHGGDAAKVREEMLFVLDYPDRVNGRLTVYEPPEFLYVREEVVRAISARPAKEFSGWIGVPKSESFMAQYADYRRHQGYTYGMIGFGLAILAALAAAWRKRAALGFAAPVPALPSGALTLWRKIPVDVRTALLAAAGIAAFRLQREAILPYELLSEGDVLRVAGVTVWLLSLQTVVTGMLAVLILLAYRSWKDGERPGEAWRNALAMRLYRTVREAFLSLRVGVQAVLLFAAVFGLGFTMCAALSIGPYESPVPYMLPVAAVTAVILFYVLRQAGYLNRLLEAARAHAAGQFAGDVPVRGRSAIAELAGHWNRLRQIAETSRASEMRSERLKTELITNVSHDLRTPLTSVITYVDLLKNPDLTEEERSNYIGIIDRKSKRLKALIDDLFEATKMASGSVELNRERIDLTQLIEQALAESGAKDGAAGIEFRVRLPEKPVYAHVDGQKMWRVFDNLISNMIRYSLEGTRAYITLGRADGKAEIAFKNVSKYELGDDVDELLERFKRGDASRHTEGSGLGLAIAKSIVDLHGGSLELEVDGDLFKVTVRLPEA